MVGRLCVRLLRKFNGDICKSKLFSLMQEDKYFLVCKKTSDSYKEQDPEDIMRQSSYQSPFDN